MIKQFLMVTFQQLPVVGGTEAIAPPLNFKTSQNCSVAKKYKIQNLG